ncbi:asparaginase [Phytoactinopolyspora limicola]|uniref:asparaginase n=1 Tax=Phytoactinopolyspora limicola TaxID=2715536 RepID=UPI001B7D7E4A|nr:asparaginase [Phytoactinopolyspora limicola]
MTADPVVLAEVVRSGMVESRHRGSVVALDVDGSIAYELGDPAAPMFPRSASKPVQAAAMVGCGLVVDEDLLALAAASHSGEEFHLTGVRRILGEAGLDESALRNTPDWPLGVAAREAAILRGERPSSLAQNCSGKHGAMVATCVARGWPIESYLDPEHPLQRAIADTLAGFAGESPAGMAVDGCGAPLIAFTLTGVARMFRALVLAAPGTPGRQVVDAMQAHPETVSGTDRDEARLLRGIPGLVAKSGAEAVFATALDDGRAIAVKIDDGGSRASVVVAATALRRLGLRAPVLDELATIPVLGGGRPVGEIRASAGWSTS